MDERAQVHILEPLSDRDLSALLGSVRAAIRDMGGKPPRPLLQVIEVIEECQAHRARISGSK